ncbi:MAG: shikimate kinase [Spirochaetia bacterium]
MNSHIVLMGMKHCGKSTIGRIIAKKWGRRFIDLDAEMERIYSASSHRSVRQIYSDEGKDFFTRLEYSAATGLSVRLRESAPVIIALGGGTIENRRAMEAVKQIGKLVYLKEDAQVLFERIERKGLPPFLSKFKPRSDFQNLYDNRTELYDREADFIIDLEGCTVEQGVELVSKKLKAVPNAG